MEKKKRGKFVLTKKEMAQAIDSGNLIFFKKSRVILPKDVYDVATITNTPINPETLLPIFRYREVEQTTRHLRKGVHQHWLILQYDRRRRRIIQREILA